VIGRWAIAAVSLAPPRFPGEPLRCCSYERPEYMLDLRIVEVGVQNQLAIARSASTG